MKAFLTKIYDFTGNAIIYFIGWFFGGIIGGLVAMLTVLFAVYAFLYAVILLILFLPFHFHDLKSFYLNKNWFGFFGRLIVLFTIGSYIGGFVALASGLMDFPGTPLLGFVFFIATILTWLGIPIYLILIRYYYHGDFMKKTRQIIRGLEKIGILWRY